MSYEPSVIRQFMMDHLSDADINELSHDYLRPAYDQFSQNMTKREKIHVLIEYADKHDCLENLLAALQIKNPEQYPQHFPSIAVEPPSAPRIRQRHPRQIFMCHAHQDAEFAHRLARDLIATGWQVWIAPDDIRPGEKWVDAIQRGLDESGVFVVALTPAAVESDWVTTETNAAIAAEHKRLVRFIPLQVQSCVVPMLWDSYQCISFRDYGSGLAALVQALNSTPAAGAPPVDQRVPGPPAAPPRRSRRSAIDRRWFIAVVIIALVACAAVLIAVPEVQQWLGLAAPTATPMPGASPTAAPTRAPTAAMTPSSTPTVTPSPTAAPTVDVPAAVARENAGVFREPRATTSVDSVRPGQAVTVLGRSPQGNWLYVQTISGQQGFVYRPMFDWTGDFQALTPVPVSVTPLPTTPSTPSPTPSGCPSDRTGFIDLDFYTIGNPICPPRPGYHLFLQGQGALSPFKYYVDGKQVYVGSDQFTYDYYLPAGNTRVKVVAEVEACDGRRVEKVLDLRPVVCP